MNRTFKLTIGIITLFIIISCSYKVVVNHNYRKQYKEINKAIHIDTLETKYLKVHYKTGEVALYDKWSFGDGQDSLTCHGSLYNFNRNLTTYGDLSTSVEDIAIVETNHPDMVLEDKDRVLRALTLLTSFNAILGAVCLTTPKACFGSCPTFYLEPDLDVHYADAEAFSNAISPSLATSDIDDLDATHTGPYLSVFLKNEALETHVLDKVNLLTIPVEENQFALQTDNGAYYLTENFYSYSSVKGEFVEDENAMKYIDDAEYFSLTDSFDLTKKEELIFNFDNYDSTQKALVVNFRQSLVTTFLIYEAISCAGDETSDFMTKIETHEGIRNSLWGPFEKLGTLRFEALNERTGEWVVLDELYETGPIARNKQLILLPDFLEDEESIQIRLNMAQGYWRIDCVALTHVIDQVEPSVHKPLEVIFENKPLPNASEWLASIDDDPLVTMPTEEYELIFKMPNQFQKFQLFLDNHGYYIEWLRDEWKKEKDLEKLYGLIMNDSETWETLAREFKTLESQMEEQFWSSKIVEEQ